MRKLSRGLFSTPSLTAFTRIFAAVALSVFISAGYVFAQEVTGTISGTVVDETKAVVPGATVKATHVATNTVYTATSSSSGSFVFPKVRLGTYSVSVEAQSFRRAVVQDVLVEVGKTSRLTVSLKVGGLQEEVIIDATDAQALVNTSDAELSTVVDEKRVLELPLNGRNASQLALNEAGVYFERSPDGQGNKVVD